MRIALGLEYEGSAFCGWQTQPSRCGVQDALETALAQIADAPVSTVCAGRTDTGVHALAQVVHFDTEAARPESAWVRGTNALLPEGVAVLWAQPVSQEFHARYSATARRYAYFLLNRRQRPALLAGKVGWFHHDLSVHDMRAAADLLVGTHDFSTFRSAECQAKNPVRTLRSISIERDCELLRFDFEANAFLHHMVRNLMGALVYVGCGRRDPLWVARILQRRDRAEAAPTFAPSGLYLAAVEYDAVWNLPAASNPDPLGKLLKNANR
jgi:tRNA pseudouridine38-40 synthase